MVVEMFACQMGNEMFDPSTYSKYRFDQFVRRCGLGQFLLKENVFPFNFPLGPKQQHVGEPSKGPVSAAVWTRFGSPGSDLEQTTVHRRVCSKVVAANVSSRQSRASMHVADCLRSSSKNLKA